MPRIYKRMPLPVMFWKRVLIRPDDCWLWTGPHTPHGYASFHISRKEEGQPKSQPAYRFAYKLLIGPIPEGLVLDHLCRNPLCVNPEHLEPVTQSENLLRGKTVNAANAAKTHCDRGHPFTPENTGFNKGPHPGRFCRICHREWVRNSYQQNIEERRRRNRERMRRVRSQGK